MATSTDTRCLHCDATLTARDMAEGWCDSCGKRLPSGSKPASKVAEAPAAPPASRSRAMVWGVVALGMLFAAAAIAAASAV